jgi:putative sigma-54 modulation protein
MRLALTGRNIDITPGLRQLVTRRLARLERHLNDSAVSAQVVLHTEKFRRSTDIVVHTRGDHILRGSGSAEAWAASITEAVEKVAQQAARVKGKWEARRKRAAPVSPIAEDSTAADAPATPRRRVVRMRRYPVKPMSVDDAVLALEDGPHAFVVFRDAESEAVLIVFRRPDGLVGLIEPEA